VDKKQLVTCLKSKIEKDVAEYAGEVIAREMLDRRSQINAIIKEYLDSPRGIKMLRICTIDSLNSVMENGILDAISITSLNKLTQYAVMNLLKPEVKEHITGKK